MREGRYWTYIVASKSGTLYTGMTNDIFLRVKQHKDKSVEGFSTKYGCDRLIWFEEWTTALAAIKREKQIKGWTRAKKVALVESINRRWDDLALNWGRELVIPNESLAELEEKQQRLKRLGAASQG